MRDNQYQTFKEGARACCCYFLPVCRCHLRFFFYLDSFFPSPPQLPSACFYVCLSRFPSNEIRFVYFPPFACFSRRVPIMQRSTRGSRGVCLLITVHQP